MYVPQVQAAACMCAEVDAFLIKILQIDRNNIVHNVISINSQ